MYRDSSHQRGGARKRRKLVWIVFVLAVFALLVGGYVVAKQIFTPKAEMVVRKLQFDASVSEAEKSLITETVAKQNIMLGTDVAVSAKTALEAEGAVLQAYVPVTGFYSSRQSITSDELKELPLSLPAEIDTVVKSSILELLGRELETVEELTATDEIGSSDIAFIPANRLDGKVKLLSLDGAYYLDDFIKGAVFRKAVFSGGSAEDLTGLQYASLPAEESVLSFNQTGVTALTRKMIVRLPSVPSAAYFSEQIGDFLATADITHVSNEVSFKAGCAVDNIRFCSPPEMIETLKASGVDVVELTGNHNNDVGAEFNAESIKLYQSLGWGTFGGGLNAEEAAKPYTADKKGTKLTLLGYNYADGPGSGALATATSAGANGFDVERIKSDIANAKAAGYFVVVDVQFFECYAYPDGYVEYPQCDAPIPNQTEVFRQIIDLGADMVVGSSAHQPQTYELYNGKPIYYGLGNMYFDQTEWPGTERGIILTHYFFEGRLLQTKLTPTVYGRDLQTRMMDESEAVKLLDRLSRARP